MSKPVRRGGPPPSRRPVQPKRRGPKVHKRSSIDRMIAMLPVSERTLQRVATWSIMGVITAGALGVTELKPKSGFYDYDAKYTDGMTEHVYPADIPDQIAAACMQIARDAHRLLGCKGCSRADFRWDDSLGEAGLFLLEVNTQPGMTPLSLAPEQARHRGMSYAEFVQRIVAEALHRVEKTS